MWRTSRIKALRERYGETQAKFCNRLGISLSTFRQYEQGQMEVMPPVRLLLERLEEDWKKNDIRELVPA